MKRLYYNAEIVTMSSPEVYDYMICENGIIRYVGKGEAPGGDFEKTDLKGSAVLPAFIDAHSHFAAEANSQLQCSLNGTASFDEIKKRIADYIAKRDIKPGQWVKAEGYDHNLLKEGVHPNRSLLDSICPENPLVVSHKSGHMGVFNSKALKDLDVSASAKPPEGGKFGYTDGQLNGYMEENAYMYYIKKAPISSAEEFMSAFEKAQDKYASYGISTVQEGMLVKELCPLYKVLIRSGILKLDVVGYADYSHADEIYSLLIGEHKHFRMGGIKLFLDGSPQGRTAYMLDPYKGEKEYRGYPVIGDQELMSAIEYAAERRLQLLAHCNGDAAAEQFLRCVEASAKRYPVILRLRFVMIHAQFLRPSQLDRVKQCGIIPSFFTAHSYYWGDTHIKNFGFNRARGISPAGSALERGITFTFHQDSPVIEPDMLKTVRCAAERITKAGVRLKCEEIPVFDALRAITVNAACQYGEESKKGTLEAGKSEDLVILDKNPLKVQISRLSGINILKTIKSGNTVYLRG